MLAFSVDSPRCDPRAILRIKFPVEYMRGRGYKLQAWSTWHMGCLMSVAGENAAFSGPAIQPGHRLVSSVMRSAGLCDSHFCSSQAQTKDWIYVSSAGRQFGTGMSAGPAQRRFDRVFTRDEFPRG